MYSGGGDGIDHSNVAASHGLSPAISPPFFDLKKLYRKSSSDGAIRNAPMDEIMLNVSHPWPASYV